MTKIKIISRSEITPHQEMDADFIICKDGLTDDQIEQLIKGFEKHAQNSEQQWVHLVDRRWLALMDGSKTDTLRLNEGFIHKGFLLYRSCSEQYKTVVYVTGVYYVPLVETLKITGTDERTPDEATLLKQLQVHYPDITLDTHLLLAMHLSVPDTLKKYPEEVKRILEQS